MKKLLVVAMLALTLASSVVLPAMASGTVGKGDKDGNVVPLKCWCCPLPGGAQICVCVAWDPK